MVDRAGVRAGDVLEAIDGIALRAPSDLRRALMQMGDVASIAEQSVTVDRRPRDPHVEYGHIERDVRLRTLVHGKGSLGVLFLQGIALSSIEDPSPVTNVLRALPSVTLMELERRGVGDSEGAPPDFLTEVEDYRAALAVLSARCDEVALFGHSVGGMIAPILRNSAAIAVYGTSAMRWRACLEASTRRQLALRGVHDVEPILARERARIDDGEDERSPEFHAQLDAIDLPAAWRSTTCPRLVLHGEYDWVVSEKEAREIDPRAQILPQLDHAMTAHDSLHQSLLALGRGRWVNIPEIHQFLQGMRRAAFAV